ncbi:PAS domain-containing sensor histidine kinase [Arenibacter palladensis]|mgnify:CR=1 FL=1|uniref:PAS domain-containing sensor histidine kinase n=1 Tax=Arenibacter palladensis TaxID=237373 RepID=UPI0026E43EAE|nr:PAS domain-containing sensor histidine kinase [Arenibacter palladensis]MDO6604489.1 PAS domain-containing sensor histidine kinase [Arenibacter palladensis]
MIWYNLYNRFKRIKRVKERTRRELENQIAELQKQNEILKSLLAFQNGEEKDETEKYANTILNNMGDAVFVKDNGSRLLLVNDAFCNLFNLPRTKIIGKTLAENVPPDERESFLRIDKQVLLDGIDNINEEPLTLAEGQKRIISTRKSRFIDEDGKKFLVGVIRDITERIEAEEDLRESELQLRELNATKDKLFSIIAHDLRSPFNNILVLSDILNAQLKESENFDAKEYLGLIHSTSKNTLVLLENLLDWAKSQSGQISFKNEKINISTVVHEILELSISIAQTKGISIKVNVTEEAEINSDKKILKTIIRNLMSNAIKYSRPGDKITISAVEEEDLVKIVISDSGVGMDDDTLENLFSITTNTPLPGTLNEKGSGFGLVLCKEFIEKLGGKIWVESEKGKGSDFIFTIPRN